MDGKNTIRRLINSITYYLLLRAFSNLARFAYDTVREIPRAEKEREKERNKKKTIRERERYERLFGLDFHFLTRNVYGTHTRACADLIYGERIAYAENCIRPMNREGLRGRY